MLDVDGNVVVKFRDGKLIKVVFCGASGHARLTSPLPEQETVSARPCQTLTSWLVTLLMCVPLEKCWQLLAYGICRASGYG